MESRLTIGIVGLGLIGGSLAFALKDFQNAEIIGSDINAGVCERAVDIGAVSSAQTDPSSLLRRSDLVILCLYPAQTEEIIKTAEFKPGAVITEVCGVKSGLVQRLRGMLPNDVDYVPCHPMAGKEVGGFENAEETLFLGAGFIVTPPSGVKTESVNLIIRMAKHIGAANITCRTPEEHDEIIAYTSHLCHISALALCLDYPAGITRDFLGGSFRDCTRVANINTELWSSLLLENKDNVLNALTEYQKSLETLKSSIADDNKAGLIALLKNAKENKAVLQNKKSSD